MVNLGWVPLDKRNEISKEPPVEAIEWTNDMFNKNSCKFIYIKVFMR